MRGMSRSGCYRLRDIQPPQAPAKKSKGLMATPKWNKGLGKRAADEWKWGRNRHWGIGIGVMDFTPALRQGQRNRKFAQ
jgi:hypothetical protein